MNPCDHYFLVCMGDLSSTDSTDDGYCDLMRFVTEEIEDEDSIVFDNTIGVLDNPQTAIFTSWPGSFSMKVDVWDKDSGIFSSDDLVEKLRHNFTIRPSTDEEPMEIHFIPIIGRTTLHMSLVVRCDENYYGPSCSCQPSDDDVNGHYACAEDGTKLCLPGWTGESCTENVDNCRDVPCLNDGICINYDDSSDHGFFCVCRSGYSGELCETPLEAQVSLKVELINYTNPSGRGANGRCCDYIVSAQDVCRMNPCDHYFVICLDSRTSTDSDSTDSEYCDILHFVTDTVENQDQNINLQDELLPVNSGIVDWPGTFRVKVDVWDGDSGFFDSDDLVDNLRDTISIQAGPPGTVTYQYLPLIGRTTLVMLVTVETEYEGYDSWY